MKIQIPLVLLQRGVLSRFPAKMTLVHVHVLFSTAKTRPRNRPRLRMQRFLRFT